MVMDNKRYEDRAYGSTAMSRDGIEDLLSAARAILVPLMRD
jgi:hypothetical protein